MGRTAFAFVLLLIAGVLAAPGALAQGKGTWFSGFSTIVVDAKTGEVIHSTRGDELRHPASLAKIMTLYLLFAELEAGRLRLDSSIPVSAEAARQPPSKLGLKAGERIRVEDAIRAVITRSANDVALAIAEAVAGDEDSFARLMTQRARALGMTRTVFRNASGLPDPDQVTTAREMALLGLAIQDRFPQYYSYFSTRTFRWRGVAIGNHNRLLGSVDGVDGIKTGYTHASGYNLVSNVKRNSRHIVAVVLGGQTGAARDQHMRDLIAQQIRHAHAGPRTAPRFVERGVPLPVPSPVAAAAPRLAPAPGSSAPIERRPVRILSMDRDGAVVAEGDRPARTLPVSTLSAASVQTPLQAAPTGIAPAGRVVTFAPPPAAAEAAAASTHASPEVEPVAVAAPPAPEAKPAPRGEWAIQIGAFPNAAQAEERLAAARAAAAAALAKGDPYTEKTMRGATELYRARFAGFDEPGARRACEALKKNDFACFVARN